MTIDLESARMRPVSLEQSRGHLTGDDRVLWIAGDISCVMISCCAGAELQVRRRDDILLRELYPSKSDLYERARDLRAEYGGAAER
jgi:hypothetical protein